MTSLSLAVVLQMALLANGENSYADAHAQVLKTGEPMVVMVTANWCPACETMKKNVLPQVEEHGVLGRVIFAVVNVDREQELGKRLMNGGPIPQLLMFRRTDAGWRLRRLIGGHSTAQVEEFINQGIELQRKQTEPTPAAAEPSQDSKQESKSADDSQPSPTGQVRTVSRPASNSQTR